MEIFKLNPRNYNARNIHAKAYYIVGVMSNSEINLRVEKGHWIKSRWDECRVLSDGCPSKSYQDRWLVDHEDELIELAEETFKMKFEAYPPKPIDWERKQEIADRSVLRRVRKEEQREIWLRRELEAGRRPKKVKEWEARIQGNPSKRDNRPFVEPWELKLAEEFRPELLANRREPDQLPVGRLPKPLSDKTYACTDQPVTLEDGTVLTRVKNEYKPDKTEKYYITYSYNGKIDTYEGDLNIIPGKVYTVKDLYRIFRSNISKEIGTGVSEIHIIAIF